MENRLRKLTISLIGSCALILLYALYESEAFAWVVLIIPVSITSHMIALRSNYGNLVHTVAAILLGLIIFISFSGYLCAALLSLFAVKFNFNYRPSSVHPRLLIDRSLGPLIFTLLLVVKFVLIWMNISYAHYEDNMSNESIIFWSSIISLGFFHHIIVESKRNYNHLKYELATKEKNWTNNVMTLLSHNIRTPIASMGNRVDIIKLKKSEGIAISEEDIESLVDDRERINSIVHGLLSKSSRNIISSKNVSELSINQAINEYADRVKITKPEGIDFNLSSNDKIALDLALESVISNSEKYGASHIQITLRDNENEVSISVIDNGEGMNSETLERYGTPFNSSQSKKGGSGLGVYFALQLVKDAGWQWSAESSLGKGTTVTFSIPKQLLVL